MTPRKNCLAARGSRVSQTQRHTLPWPDVDHMIPACFHSNTWRDPSREICTAAPPHREINRPQDRPRTRLRSKEFNLLNHYLHISKQEYCVRQKFWKSVFESVKRMNGAQVAAGREEWKRSVEALWGALSRKSKWTFPDEARLCRTKYWEII